MDIQSAVRVITRDEILIHAPIQSIWDTQTDATQPAAFANATHNPHRPCHR